MDARESLRNKRLAGLRNIAGKHNTSWLAGRSSKPRPAGILRRYRPLFLALAIFMLGNTIAKRGRLEDNAYLLAEHSADTALVLSADGVRTDMSVGELSWYIVRMERAVNEQALRYNADDPKAYWKLRISNYDQASYIYELAKDTVTDYATRDLIYAREAEAAGFALDDEEQRKIRYDAEREWLKLTEREKSATGLEADDIQRAMERERTAAAYMSSLRDQGIEDVDVGGSYYAVIRENYQAELLPEVDEQLRLGMITIN